MKRQVTMLLKKGLPALFVLGGFFMIYTWLQSTKPDVVARSPSEQTWTITVIEAKMGIARPAERAFGTVVAARDAELRFGVAGEVGFVSDNLQNGVDVQAGDVLAKLDLERLTLALNDIRAQMDAEKRQGDALARQVELRTRAVERLTKMLSRNVATEAKADEAELALSVAGNQLVQSRAKLKQLKVAEKNRLKDLEDATLIAPFDGTLSAVSLALGNRVSNANKIATLTDLSRLEVPFVVAADIYANAPSIIGQTISLSWQSGGKVVATAQAVLTRSEIIVDKTDGGGRLYAELPADAARTLPPGAFVQIDFIGREFVDAFELPEEALVGQDKVYVVEEGRARERLITVLQRAPGRIWVSGALMTGDKVIATRLPGIGDGLKVRIADPK
jgi:RND family efflux transporter MFP subunit